MPSAVCPPPPALCASCVCCARSSLCVSARIVSVHPDSPALVNQLMHRERNFSSLHCSALCRPSRSLCGCAAAKYMYHYALRLEAEVDLAQPHMLQKQVLNRFFLCLAHLPLVCFWMLLSRFRPLSRVSLCWCSCASHVWRCVWCCLQRSVAVDFLISLTDSFFVVFLPLHRRRTRSWR